MKRFITKIGSFVLPVIALAMLLEVLLRGIPNDYRLKREYLDTHVAEIETLVLGSSHSFYGLDPVCFSTNTFNASHISQSLSYDYAILEKYKNQLTNLKTLIIPISYFTFFETLESGPEAWRNKNYAIYYDISLTNSLWDYSEVLRNRLEINVKRLSNYYIKKQPALTSSPLGWGTNYTVNSKTDLDKAGVNTANKHSVDLNSQEVMSIAKQNKQLLKRIQKWSVTNNVKLLLFTPPTYTSYTESLNAAQLTRSIAYIEQVCNDTSNCEYQNFLNNSLFTKEDFYDPDHLSHAGAKKLSRLINTWVKEN